MLWLMKDTLAKWKILGLYLSGGQGESHATSVGLELSPDPIRSTSSVKRERGGDGGKRERKKEREKEEKAKLRK